MVVPPGNRYAYNGDFGLAYQVVGDGPIDLLYLPGWVSNVEANWLVPDNARFLERLSSFSRLIVTDRRGSGCSDGPAAGQAVTLEESVEDLKLVARAAFSSRAALFGVQETAFVAMLAAALYPARFDRLILFGASATWKRTEETPWEWSEDQWEDTLSAFSGNASAEMAESYIRAALPSYAGDPVAIRRMTMLLSLTQGPGAGLADTRMFKEVDLRDLLPSIRVPTLILQRIDDPVTSMQGARHLAERIEGATLIELPGNDTLPWVGEVDPVLEEIERFLTGSTGARPPSPRTLATVLFTDIVDSTQRATELGDRAFHDLLERHHRIVRAELGRHHGIEIDTAGDGFFATFDGPAAAVGCAVAVRDAVEALGIQIRAGVHTGEVETIDGKIGGIGVHIGARVSAAAGPSEVLVSSTVKDLVAGSGLVLEDAGDHELKGVPDRWRLYRVVS